MIACVGQQVISGKRILDGFDIKWDQTSPAFPPSYQDLMVVMLGLSADECSPQISPDFVQNLADRTGAEENLGKRR